MPYRMSSASNGRAARTNRLRTSRSPGQSQNAPGTDRAQIWQLRFPRSLRLLFRVPVPLCRPFKSLSVVLLKHLQPCPKPARSDFVAFSKKFLERRVHIFLVVDPHAYKPILTAKPVFEDRKQGARRASVTRSAFLPDFAVSKKVAGGNQIIS